MAATAKELIARLEGEQALTKGQWAGLLAAYEQPGLAEYLAEKAGALRDRIFGRNVYLRGLIEFSSYCKNNCLYCGIRRDNKNVSRYRLTPEEIIGRCEAGHQLGFRTFVLQGGEDPHYQSENLVELVSEMRLKFPDCAITLSVGELGREFYEKLFKAGADRFLLRHETADKDHYEKLHPSDMSFDNRRRCLFELKDIGFQVGAGFMVGSPWQTFESLAEDFLFLKEIEPQMVGIGPFIPHPETPLAAFSAGDVKLTLFILGLVRLLLPKSLLPATTALGTLSGPGREMALEFGANVMMPNLSPLNVRKKYEIYTGKIHLDEEAAEGVSRLRKHLAALGYETPVNRGDFPGYEIKH